MARNIKKTAFSTAADRRLIEAMGATVGRLFETIGLQDKAAAEDAPGPSAGAARLRRKPPARPGLVDLTIGAAEEVESFLIEQSARIAYLEDLTLTDELTGLRNRRGFNEELRRTLAAANRYGDQGVLVICDLDNFKDINDRYGHHVGDYVLLQIARIIGREIRETDVVARLGGDEFAVLMNQTKWPNGVKRAKMLNQALNRTIVTYEGHDIAVCASFGMEPFGPNDEETALIARADAAMYVNKRKRAFARRDGHTSMVRVSADHK